MNEKTEQKIDDLLEKATLGYAYIYPKGGAGWDERLLFELTPENIANIVMQNAFTSNGVIVTDIFDQLICDSMFGGFLNRCPNQELCHEIVSFLAPLQMGQGEPKDVVFATYDEMTKYGNLDEEQDNSFDMKLI